MSYLVLARKFRPQNFSEVYAQDHVTRILQNAIEMKRIAHAYLFTGPRGVGKTSMARIFAKSLNCQTNGPSPVPCNKCQNCQEITQGISSDVIEIDGASNTSVDDVRDIQKELMYSTNTSLYKIYIIDEVHMLSKNAFNALLKTLEEPPENVIFLFATTEPHKVLPTIISRCQRYDFKRIPIPAIVDRLSYIAQNDDINIDDDGKFMIAKKADGSMRDALSLMDQVLSFGGKNVTYDQILDIFGIVDFEVYRQILQGILDNDSSSIIKIFHGVLEKGNDIQELINGLMDYIRGIIMLRLGVNIDDVSEEIKSGMQPFTQQFTENDLLYLISLLIKTKSDVKMSNNPILVAEMSFLKLSKLSHIHSVEEIIKDIKSGKTPLPQQNQAIPVFKPKVNTDDIQKRTEELKRKMVADVDSSKPTIEEFSEDVYNKYHDQISSRIKKEKPFIASFYNKTTLDKMISGRIHLDCPDKITYERLQRNKEDLENIVSKYLGKEINFNFKIKETKKEKTISNPEIEDIRKESPGLADFIETTNSTFSN